MAEKSTSQDNGGPDLLDADQLIDEIIAQKGPQKYTGGLSEDNWEEEIEQIPLFMTKPPSDIDPIKSPGLAALQEIKYQEETPEGRALVLKEDGNEYFKQKKYKEAVMTYSEALKQNSSDSNLNAILYCNRSAAHYHLSNYRSSINDAIASKTIKQDHLKAYIRGAEASFKLKIFDDAIAWCNQGLQIDTSNDRLLELRKVAILEKKKKERDNRKQKLSDKEKKNNDKKLIEAIKSRGIKIATSSDQMTSQDSDQESDIFLKLVGPHPDITRVHLDEEGYLIWPVFLMYPEYGQSDLIESFHEYNIFLDHINVIFGEEIASWDVEKKYTPENIEIWYEDISSPGTYFQVSVQSTLADVISSPKYIVVSGTPTFIVLAAGSTFRQQFIKS